MKNKRPLALLTTLAATPAFAAPFLAIGDNAELFLTGSTSVRFEDNIDYSDTNEKADEIFEFTPGAELVFGKSGLNRGSLAIYERFVAYSDNTQFNDELFNAVFQSAYDGAKLSLKTNAAYREQNQTTQDVQAIIASTDISAGASGEVAITEKTKFGAGLQYADKDYEPAGLADQTTYTVPVNYYFAIRPKVDLSAGVRYRSTDVDQAFSDSDDFYFNVGARGEFTPKLSGNFSVGYTMRDADAPLGVDGEDTLLGFNAGLAYAYSQKTQITFDASNDFDTGSIGAGQEKTSFTLGANSQVVPALSLRSSVTYQQIDYINFVRTDDYLIFNVGASYTLNEHVSFDASYSHYNNDSDFVGAEFAANVFSLSANFRY
jgi:polysaccharide biosynthesis protein VpsM